jgi:hypothetical protein
MLLAWERKESMAIFLNLEGGVPVAMEWFAWRGRVAVQEAAC